MKYIVDRIEEGSAILESSDGKIYSIPFGILPPGAGEGAVVSITLDRIEEKERRKTAAQLMKKVWKD